MQALRTFLSLIRVWHVIAALAVTILLAVARPLFGPPMDSLAKWLLLLIAPPLLLFSVAFLAYVATGRHDRAAAIFPSVFLVALPFVALPAMEAVRRGNDVTIGVIAVLSIAIALVFIAIFVAARPAFLKRRN
ncbi:MAG: hypothetical protein V4696_07675 [Pseudomonadota bacterium]